MSHTLLLGDCIEQMRTLPEQSVNCCVTSPPYFGLRDYGHDGQIGLEDSPDAYVQRLVEVFREVRRVLRDDGTLWLNLGDSYANNGTGGNGATGGRDKSTLQSSMPPIGTTPVKKTVPDGLKPKDLIGIPWRVAFALQADGWYLRQDIIWHKPNPMPESVRDRCTKAHEYIFLLSKSERYYFDSEAMQEPASKGAAGSEFHTGKTGAHQLGRASTKPRTAGNKSHKYVTAYDGSDTEEHRTKAGLMNIADTPWETRNRRSVWTVATKPYKEAHFATFPPDLIRPCILAGCPPAGKRCDCDEVIASPLGSGPVEDPTMQTGRAGMNRPRRNDEGTRPITRREQRHEAIEMKASPHRSEMERECGPAFAHYIRTDKSGARPLPHDIRKKYMQAGWITEAPACAHPVEDAGTVLDPFAGSGTTAMVAIQLGRQAISCELNPDYAELIHKRIAATQPGFAF